MLKPTVPFPIQAAGGTGAEFNRRFVRLGHTVDRPMRIVLSHSFMSLRAYVSHNGNYSVIKFTMQYNVIKYNAVPCIYIKTIDDRGD